MMTINNRHLASHAITATEYKQKFPEAKLLSEASAQKLSERSQRSNAHRKGVSRTEAEKANIRAGILAGLAVKPRGPRGPMPQAQRDLQSRIATERYENGFQHPNLGKSLDVKVREKIGKTLSGRKVGSGPALKAVATKLERGHDFGASMRGRTHTEETKRVIAAKASARQRALRSSLREPMSGRVAEAGLRLLNAIDDDLFHLQCTKCDYAFTRTVQCFQPSKFHTEVCPQCFPSTAISAGENEVAAFIQSIIPDTRVLRSEVQTIAPMEIDILVPSIGLAVEYCGLYYHSVQAGRHRLYHKFKMDRCREAGLRLLTIFEDEWLNKRPIVESMLRNACGTISTKLDARKCLVRTLDSAEAAAFLNANHIQGRGRSNVRYGLVYKGEVVSVMTFMKGDVSHRNKGWEINRFATKLNYTVRGGASRLFRQFIADVQPDAVTSFADLRYGQGKVYTQLGFEWIGDTQPNYWYFRPNDMRRYHRYALRKTSTDPKDQTEFDLRRAEGWNWLYDCGHAKWSWSRSKP